MKSFLGNSIPIVQYSRVALALCIALLPGCGGDTGDATSPPTPPVTVTDIDGNVYQTVTIGTQVWMAENLKTTRYRDGAVIPKVTDNAWVTLTTGAYDEIGTSTTYGRWYNWYAVNDPRSICPEAWHVPTDAEFAALTTHLGGGSVAGGKLKEAGMAHWATPNTGATNETGFTALPSGTRYYGFDSQGNYGNWWSATGNGGNAYHLNMGHYYADAGLGSLEKVTGMTVRCVWD